MNIVLKDGTTLLGLYDVLEYVQQQCGDEIADSIQDYIDEKVDGLNYEIECLKEEMQSYDVENDSMRTAILESTMFIKDGMDYVLETNRLSRTIVCDTFKKIQSILEDVE